MGSDHLLLFDLSIHGHHPSYIQLLIEGWQQRRGQLSILVSPRFLTAHADVVALASGEIAFVAITPAEEATLVPRNSGIQRNRRNLQEWELFRRYARDLKATQAVLLYLDTYLLALALGLGSPCPWSGIYFRPTFHYGTLIKRPPTAKEHLQSWRERLILGRALADPNLQILFSLDRFATGAIAQIAPQAEVVWLPDPVRTALPELAEVEVLRRSLAPDPARRVFLIFGSLTERKGIFELLQALSLLDPSLLERLCLLIVGEAEPENQARIEALVEVACRAGSLQAIRRYAFVPEADVGLYYQLADVVLALYQRHVGMSGILLWAAAAGKPVLSSDYGLMGEIVRRYRLGLTVESSSPAAIAAGLGHCLQADLADLADPGGMAQLVQEHKADFFAKTILDSLQARA